jgi:hypothetical protein
MICNVICGTVCARRPSGRAWTQATKERGADEANDNCNAVFSNMGQFYSHVEKILTHTNLAYVFILVSRKRINPEVETHLALGFIRW